MGVPLVTVQRILRHKDVRLTASTYGHLSIEDMREGLSHFPLGSLDALVPGALPAPILPVAPSRWAPVGRPASPNKKKAADPEGNPSKISGLRMSGRQDLNLRPLGPEAGWQAIAGIGPLATGSRRAPGGDAASVHLAVDDGGHAHAVPDAEGGCAVAQVAALELVEQRREEHRAGGAERVPERNCPSVHVDPVERDA